MSQKNEISRPIRNSWTSISLRRLLIFTAFVAGFFGFTRAASSSELPYAAVFAVACLALALGVLSRRYVGAAIICVVLAFASLVTTSIQWDGGFPFAEVRISVVDRDGKPIEDVQMSITRRLTGRPAFGYPLAEFTDTPLLSSEKGLIVCHQTRSGLQFGGQSWLLFWCMPIGAKAPKFDVHFEHPRYPRKSIDVLRLFDSEHEFYEDFPTTTIELHGTTEEIPIYEQQIVL